MESRMTPTHPTPPPQPPQSSDTLQLASSAAQARLDAYAAGYRAGRAAAGVSLPYLADALLAERMDGWRAGSAGV